MKVVTHASHSYFGPNHASRWSRCVMCITHLPEFGTHPSSETQGQSVGWGEKAGRKFLSTGERAPGYWLSPSYFQKFKRMPAPDWAQKMLCIIVPNQWTVSPEFFSWVRTQRLLSRSCTKEMHAVRKLSVWYKIPIWFQNTVCPKTKDPFRKIQAWAYNRYSCLHLSRLAWILGSF